MTTPTTPTTTTTFEQIIEKASTVADQRTKVANELRKYATETVFPQISKAIGKLGYKWVTIQTGNKIYANQSKIELEYETIYITKFCVNKDGSFSFEEATDWNYHENKSVGFKDFDRDFIFCLNGLIEFIEGLKTKVIKLTEKEQKIIENAKNLINND